MQLRRSTARLAALTTLLPLAAAAAGAAAIEVRSFSNQLPVGPLARLANLAGRVEIVPGSGAKMTIETTVHAAGRDAAETARLLTGMKWVKGRDGKGREEWVLTYPVERYRGFHYPDPRHTSGPSFWGGLFDGATSSLYRGEKVRIYGHARTGVPTLYADLRIVMPATSKLAVRNVVGPIDAGNLAGELSIDTGCGDVKVAGFDGHLLVDTGSGDVKIGTARGESSIDTGSGDVRVAHLIGNGTIDTGSGDVRVEEVAAGKLSIDTGSGAIFVGRGSAGTLLADTGSGGIEVSGAEVVELVADTGSGDVTLATPLARARRFTIDTGSGDVKIHGGADASFDITSDLGSGELRVAYSDAALRREGRKLVGAKRLDGRAAIHVETGSGDCTIAPEL